MVNFLHVILLRLLIDCSLDNYYHKCHDCNSTEVEAELKNEFSATFSVRILIHIIINAGGVT